MTSLLPTVCPPHVEVTGLVAGYNSLRKVLTGVDLTVMPGEIMVIMGGSGSGKTTLLNHMLGLLHPLAGSVRLLGLDIHRIDAGSRRALRRRMGVAFQSGALFSSLTVAENIMLPLRELTDLDDKTIGIITRLKLEMVNLAGFGHRMPAELSGGMIKRAALARAIVLDPQLLFCDEPTAGLDTVISAAIDQLILRLRAALGMTIVVVTHDLDSAFTIADRICVLGEGHVIALGNPEAIRRCADPRVRNLLNRHLPLVKPDPDAYLRRLLGEE
jgi:phospholipid/cholesterol/gamma-HCH transport system ATP-binding protein